MVLPGVPAVGPVVAADVRHALRSGRAVVALESSLITHGLPRPLNLEVALACEARVRGEGAVPATVAVHDGRLLVGLRREALEELSAAEDASKASRHTLAAALGRPGWAGTTVSATMIAAHAAGIAILATGGIGGVHHDAGRSFDVSADLEELARTPVAVVCSGPKSIVDARLTLEYLETRGVPVVGCGTDELPGFWARETGLPVPAGVGTPEEAAALAIRHWGLGLGTGIVFAVPVPREAELPREDAREAIAQALAEAGAAEITGAAATPWLLARIGELTGGRSVVANRALIEHNAGIAARIAVALLRHSGGDRARA